MNLLFLEPWGKNTASSPLFQQTYSSPKQFQLCIFTQYIMLTFTLLSKHSFIPKGVQLRNGYNSHLHSSLQNDHVSQCKANDIFSDLLFYFLKASPLIYYRHDNIMCYVSQSLSWLMRTECFQWHASRYLIQLQPQGHERTPKMGSARTLLTPSAGSLCFHSGVERRSPVSGSCL